MRRMEGSTRVRLVALALIVALAALVGIASDAAAQNPLLGKEGGVYGQAPGAGKFHGAGGSIDFVKGDAGITIAADATYPPTPIAVAATTGNLGGQAIYSGAKGKPNVGFAFRSVGKENPYGSAAGAGYGRTSNDEAP